MRVSSQTEARNGLIAAALSLPLTLIGVVASLALTGFVV